MFEIQLKQDKSFDSYCEFVRLTQGFLFDEVAIKKFVHSGDGIFVEIQYKRHGQLLKDITPVLFSREDFAEARAQAAGDFNRFAKTRLVERLFAEGSVAYQSSQTKADVDALADMEFIEQMKS